MPNKKKRAKSRVADKSATVVTSYARLYQYVDAFASGHLNLVILTGAAGLAKSRTVRERLAREHVGSKAMPRRSGCTPSSSPAATSWW